MTSTADAGGKKNNHTTLLADSEGKPSKECVAVLIQLDKKNVAISCVGSDLQLWMGTCRGGDYTCTQILSLIRLDCGQIYRFSGTELHC